TDPIKEHQLYLVKEQAPTCSERGFKAHYRCEKLCGLYFSDDKGTVVDPDTLFIAAAHTPGEWELTTKPTPDAPGVETLKCSVCKAPISTRNVQYTPPEYILGDIDANGKVEVADARLALRFAVNLEMLDVLQQKAGDADRSGAIEVADARLILRAAVGLETLE
ncbi:MAG: dockerin type I repeat-containing protein, partial [Clostridia bacterium]|nr:dockerin type I repeat-containing protein [Clostridia bacterium]